MKEKDYKLKVKYYEYMINKTTNESERIIHQKSLDDLNKQYNRTLTPQPVINRHHSSSNELSSNQSFSNESSSNQSSSNDDQYDEDFEKAIEASKKSFEEEMSKKIENLEITGNKHIYWYKVCSLDFHISYNENIEYEYSNQILLPKEIINKLTSNNVELDEDLIIFKLYWNNDDEFNRFNIVSPIDFIDGDIIYVPKHIFNKLNIELGNMIKIEYIINTIPNGKRLILEPLNNKFFNIKDIKSFLENSLITKYNCLKEDDVIKVFSNELGEDILFNIKKTYPTNIIKVINTDLETDFYVENLSQPSRKKRRTNYEQIDNTTNYTNNDDIIDDVKPRQISKDELREKRMAFFNNQ